jgi:hypothetical protein
VAWSALTNIAASSTYGVTLTNSTFRRNNRSKFGVEDQDRACIAAYGMNEERLTHRWTEAS